MHASLSLVLLTLFLPTLQASSETGNSNSNLDTTSPSSPLAADSDLHRSPAAHFTRGVSFLSDEHPPPPPPAALLTRADLSNDSPMVHRGRNGNDAISISSGTTSYTRSVYTLILWIYI